MTKFEWIFFTFQIKSPVPYSICYPIHLRSIHWNQKIAKTIWINAITTSFKHANNLSCKVGNIEPPRDHEKCASCRLCGRFQLAWLLRSYSFKGLLGWTNRREGLPSLFGQRCFHGIQATPLPNTPLSMVSMGWHINIILWTAALFLSREYALFLSVPSHTIAKHTTFKGFFEPHTSCCEGVLSFLSNSLLGELGWGGGCFSVCSAFGADGCLDSTALAILESWHRELPGKRLC